MRIIDRSEETWEKIARSEPYYGVLTSAQYRTDQLNDSTLAEFFRTGEEHIGHAIAKAERHLGCKLATRRALDFGCGAGRLVIPMAAAFENVVGVDVSRAYLSLARENCEKRDINNVSFVSSLDGLAAENGTFDFIHSHLVFLHIPRERGLQLVRQLVELLAPGGAGALQILYRRDISRGRRALNIARKYFLPLHWLLNVIVRRQVFEPMMQANEYPLDEVLVALTDMGVGAVHIEMTQVDEGRFAYLYFRTPPAA